MSRFRSKVDAWILIVLIVAIVVQVLALIDVLLSDAPSSTKAIVAGAVVAGVVLIAWILLRTHYTISDGRLRIVSGPFFWTVTISEITDIKETHSPFSSPALSLDRLRITYGDKRRIMISPSDKKGFLKAIERSRGLTQRN